MINPDGRRGPDRRRRRAGHRRRALRAHGVRRGRATPQSTTFVDYLLPTAAEVPIIEYGHIETPATTNPGGYKGMGEGGAIGAPPAVANAVADALASRGGARHHPAARTGEHRRPAGTDRRLARQESPSTAGLPSEHITASVRREMRHPAGVRGQGVLVASAHHEQRSAEQLGTHVLGAEVAARRRLVAADADLVVADDVLAGVERFERLAHPLHDGRQPPAHAPEIGHGVNGETPGRGRPTSARRAPSSRRW